MTHQKNRIAGQAMQGLTLERIHRTEGLEVMSISLEEGHLFPEHTSPATAVLIVLEGAIRYCDPQQEVPLNTLDYWVIPPGIPHRVKALKNSRFLITRCC